MNTQDKKLTVLMIAACPFPANYGSPASIREMSATLAGFGHRVHVLTYPFGDDLPMEGVKLHRIPDIGLKKRITVGPTAQKPLMDLLMVWHAVRLVFREKCDVIHAHNYEGGLIGILAKWLTGRPLLYNAVNTMSDELPSYKFIRPAFLARWLGWMLDRLVPIWPDAITTVSAELKSDLARIGHREDKMIVVPAGVLPEMFDGASPERFRKALGLEGKRVVLYTGTIDPFQRVDYLFEAMARLPASRGDVVLVMVCPFPQPALRESLEAMALRLGIAERVLWVASHPLPDLPHYVALADVGVAPRPQCPGHPVKLLNYMCCRLPIVVAEGGAKGITHLENGWVCRDHDAADMARGIGELLENRGLAERLGRAARDTIDREFDWRTLCRKIEVIYFRMLAPQPGVRRAIVTLPQEASRA